MSGRISHCLGVTLASLVIVIGSGPQLVLCIGEGATSWWSRAWRGAARAST